MHIDGVMKAFQIFENGEPREVKLLAKGEPTVKRVDNPLVNIAEFENKPNDYEFKHAMLMEYVPKAEDLSKWRRLNFSRMNKRESGYIADIKLVISEVAKALLELHKIGILHRDIKMENIMLSPKEMHDVTANGETIDKVKIIDLGLAYQFQEFELGDTEKIQQYVGTSEYIPLEAYGKYSGFKWDVYSLGVMLHELYYEKEPVITRDFSGQNLPWFDIAVKLSKIKNEQDEDKIKKKGCDNHFYWGSPADKRDKNKWDFLRLLNGMLKMNAEDRLTMEQVINHPFFEESNQDHMWVKDGDHCTSGLVDMLANCMGMGMSKPKVV